MSADTGRIGQAPWGAVLGRPGGEDGSSGPVPGTVVVTAPITGDGSVGTPVGISAATTAAAGSMSAANVTKLNGILPGASWTAGVVRFYALDGAAGNDANAGFSDVSMAAAGLVAKQTWAGLLAILPVAGDGRDLTVAIKPNAAGATFGTDLTFDGFVGYRNLTVVATTDFSNTATDQALSGFIQAQAGPGGSGEWTALAGGTTSVVTVASGTPTAGTALVGKRVRYTGNVTAGLANQCRAIQSVSGAAITLLQNSTLAPAVGDTFFIEGPGVQFVNILVSGIHCRGNFTLRGLRSSATFTVFDVAAPGNQITIGGCESGTSTSMLDIFDNLSFTPTGLVGTGIRVATTSAFTNVRNLSLTVSAFIGATTWRQVREHVQNGGVFRGNVILQACGAPLAQGFGIGFLFGRNNGGFRDSLIDGGGLLLEGVIGFFQNLVIQNAPADAILAGGAGNVALFSAVTSGGGNVGAGFTTQFSTACYYQFTTTTVTGTAGDMLLGPVLVKAAWTDLALTNIVDDVANVYAGAAGLVIAGVGRVLRVSNRSGGAVAPGTVVRGNGTSGQVTLASGNDATLTNSNALGVCLNTAASLADVFIATPGQVYALFDGAPTAGAAAYLSPGTPGAMTTTVPVVAANNNRVRMGRVATAAGSAGIVAFAPEAVGIVATGAA